MLCCNQLLQTWSGLKLTLYYLTGLLEGKETEAGSTSMGVRQRAGWQLDLPVAVTACFWPFPESKATYTSWVRSFLSPSQKQLQTEPISHPFAWSPPTSFTPPELPLPFLSTYKDACDYTGAPEPARNLSAYLRSADQHLPTRPTISFFLHSSTDS